MFNGIGAYVVGEPNLFPTNNRPFLVGGVHCVGTEAELLQCSHSSIGSHQCGESQTSDQEDVVISCYGRP